MKKLSDGVFGVHGEIEPEPRITNPTPSYKSNIEIAELCPSEFYVFL
jgi:hypothetical protein